MILIVIDMIADIVTYVLQISHYKHIVNVSQINEIDENQAVTDL